MWAWVHYQSLSQKMDPSFAPAMGLDGVVCKYGSDWHDSKSESEAVWPSDGLEGHREWSLWCWFKDPNCGGLPLRREEKHGGSIVFDLYVKMVKYGNDFWTLVLIASIGFRWSLDHQDCQKTTLGFFLMGVLVNQWGSFPVSLGNSSQRPTTLGFPWYFSQ